MCSQGLCVLRKTIDAVVAHITPVPTHGCLQISSIDKLVSGADVPSSTSGQAQITLARSSSSRVPGWSSKWRLLAASRGSQGQGESFALSLSTCLLVDVVKKVEVRVHLAICVVGVGRVEGHVVPVGTRVTDAVVDGAFLQSKSCHSNARYSPGGTPCECTPRLGSGAHAPGATCTTKPHLASCMWLHGAAWSAGSPAALLVTEL